MITEKSLKAFILNYRDCNIEIEKVNLELAWLQQDWVEKKNLIDASRYRKSFLDDKGNIWFKKVHFSFLNQYFI